MGDISRQRLKDLAADLGAEAGVRSFGVDTVSYDWVKFYVKDKEAREEIKSLEGKIIEIQKLPIDKEELRAAFRENIAQFRRNGLILLREHIKQAQQQERDVKLLSPANVWQILGGPAGSMIFLDYDFTGQEIDSLFEGLEQGVTQEEKNKQIAAAQQEIAKIEEMIEKKLSPKERWFYYPDGERMPYPRGCRWTAFVKVWREVVSRYLGPVDIDGCQLETPEEHAAYNLLKLSEVFKLTPLKEGTKR